MSWLRRDKSESMDAQYLLEQAGKATPATAAPPVAPSTSGFRMAVVDVFAIRGRGTVVTGQIGAGTLTNGSTVRLTRVDGSARDLTVSGIEKFRKQVPTATAGDNVGLLLAKVERAEIAAGDVLTA